MEHAYIVGEETEPAVPSNVPAVPGPFGHFSYIMKPRRHPSLTMIDGTITIYCGPIPGVRIDRAM
jgi:hypothetical protein